MFDTPGISSTPGRDHDLIRSARQQIERMSSSGATFTIAATPEVHDAWMNGSWSIPGYALLHEVHRGGQGAVFKARQDSTGRTIALKVLREDILASPQERLRFEREAHILGQLDHPGVVRIIDRGSVGKRQ